MSPQRLRTLPDGSVLAARPVGLSPAQQAAPPVRVITYTITDPALPGRGETYRVLTTPARQAPCPQLALYHERWEIGVVVDELTPINGWPGVPCAVSNPSG
jgi:hypothetical protein